MKKKYQFNPLGKNRNLQWANMSIEDFSNADRRRLYIPESQYTIPDDIYDIFMYHKFKDKYYFHPSYNEYQNIIYESLTCSYPLASLEKKLYEKYDDIIEHIMFAGKYFNLCDGMDIYIKVNDYLNEIKKLCHFYGYYIASVDYDENRNCFIYTVESLYGVTEVTDDIYKISENFNNLYHITHKKYWNKIKKLGLFPKHHDKRAVHPDRIYFLVDEYPFNNIKDLAKNLYPNDNDYLILKVDLSKNNFKVKLFLDPAYNENGVFTKENISPKCLSIFQL